MTDPASTRPRRARAPGVVAQAGVRRFAPGVVSLVLLAACAPAGRGSEGIAVDTLNGVERVVNLVSTPAASVVAAETTGTPLRIGSVEGDGPDVFGDIAAVAVGPDREVYVADAVALEIRVFSATGEHLRSFGRKGEGPGEFETIDGLVVGGDGSVLVRDPRLGRVTRFGRDGAFEDSFRLERSFMIFSDGTTFWSDSVGRIYDRITIGIGADEPDREAIVVYSPGAATDTVLAVSHRPERAFAREGDRVVFGITAPFTPQPVVAVSGVGEIAAGLGDAYRIAVMNRAGDTLRVFAREVPPDPVGEAEASAARDRLRARAEEMAPGARLDDVELPDEKPRIVKVYTDPRGGWWVGRYRGEPDSDDPTAPIPTEYDLFDASGRLLGTASLPPINLFQIGRDYVAGVEIDALGVEYAVVYDLARRG